MGDVEEADRLYWKRFAAPSPEELRRHLERFAPSRSGVTHVEHRKQAKEHRAAVAQTANVYGVDLAAPAPVAIRKSDGSRDREAEARLSRRRAATGSRKRSLSTSRHRRTTPELRREVFKLADTGLRPYPIAKALDVSEQRVKSILAQPRPENLAA
jgi:hypothetical protein